MTIAAMKDYFSHRELGVQGAVGGVRHPGPLAQREGKLCLLFETRAGDPGGPPAGEVCFPGGPAGGRGSARGHRPPGDLGGDWHPRRGHRDPGPLDVIQDISDRVIYPFLGLVSPAGWPTWPPARRR